MASSVLVREAAKLDRKTSVVGTGNWKVELAADLAFEDDMAPARSA